MDANDPRLTAYALDELHDPAQQAEVEAAMAADPALAAEVEDIRRMGVWLKQAVGAQRPPTSPAIRATVEAALANGQAPSSATNHAGNGAPAFVSAPASDATTGSPLHAAARWTQGRNRAVTAVAAIAACTVVFALFLAYPGEQHPNVVALRSQKTDRENAQRQAGQDRAPLRSQSSQSEVEERWTAVDEEPSSRRRNRRFGEFEGMGGMGGRGAFAGSLGGFGGGMGGGGQVFDGAFGGGATDIGRGRRGDDSGIIPNPFGEPQAHTFEPAQSPSIDIDSPSPGSQKNIKQPARTWQRSTITPNTSRLMIGEREELPLQALQANVQIDGFRARVLIDLYYYNHRDRQYEGTFKIRLPAEASLYYLAFGETIYKSPKAQPLTNQMFLSVERTPDFGGDPDEIMRARRETWKEPKEARMVTKEKAAFAYTETVRRRVDPALAEWAGAGVYSARVFPLAPRTLHRIVIGYDVNLLEVGNELLYQFDLPRVPQSVIDLHVKNYGGPPPVVQPALRGKPSRTEDHDHYHFENLRTETIEVRQQAPRPLLLTGRDQQLGEFFATRLRIPATSDVQLAAPADRAARRAWFLVDTSLSAAPDRMNIYLDLLQAILNNNRDTIESFQVQFFNIESHTWQAKWVPNTPENVTAAVEYARSLVLEGATDLEQALRFATTALPPAAEASTASSDQAVDMFLLTDGAATWGAIDADALIGVAPANATLFAYTTGMSGDDTLLLARLSQSTGGAHFTVTSESAVANTAKAHRSPPWRLKAVDIPGGSDVLVAGRPVMVYPEQTLLIAGRGKPGSQPIALQLERGGQEKTFRIDVQRLESDLAPRIYGQIATDCLEAMKSATEDVAVAYARYFRVPGQTCSLLMLETEWDYQRFDIKPEDDALIVQVMAASDALERAQQEYEQQRNSAKAAFKARMRRLHLSEDFELELSPAMRIAIDGLPEEIFRVVRRPLECKLRHWPDLPSAYQDEVLSERPLDYERVTEEAARRLQAASAADALKAVSSLVELDPGNLTLARDVAFSAMEWGMADQAYGLLERVAEARPFESATFHMLAQCLAAAGKVDLAILYYEMTLTADWQDTPFESTSALYQVAAFEYLRLLNQVERGELQARMRPFVRHRQASLKERLGMSAADLVVIITWNTDGTDVDMHVTEPNGDVCNYSHNKTQRGGRLSTDITTGLGPEIYILPKAEPGMYLIDADYFSADDNRVSTRTRVFATAYTYWGTDREQVHRATVTLPERKVRQNVLSLKFK